MRSRRPTRGSRADRRLARSIIAVSVAATAALSACGGDAAEPRPAASPDPSAAAATRVVDCAGTPVQVGEPPRRVVTVDGGAAGFLLRLGLVDRVVGTGGTDFFDAYPAADRERLGRLPVLGRIPNREQVAAARPDLVLGTSAMVLGGFSGTPTPDDVRRAGAVPFTACSSRDGAVTDLTATHRFVEDLGAIFRVRERAAALANELRSRERAVVERYADAPRVRVLALSAAPAPGQPIGTRGGGGIANGLIELAGGTNVAGDVPRDLVQVNGEEVIERDPEAIVVLTGFSARTPEQVEADIGADPILGQTTAVREQRFVRVPFTAAVTPSPLNVDVLRALAEGLHGRGR